MAIAHQNGLKVNLTTNAVLLPEKHQLLLGETAPRQISLSLHSFDANTMHTRDFRSYLQNAIDFARTFTMTTPGYISFRLWNLDGTAKADQRLRNQFILETLEQAYHLAQPIDAYVGKVHGNAIAPHTYVNFDQLFEWPDEHAPDYGFKRHLPWPAASIGDSGRWPGRSMLSGPQRPSGFGQYFHRIPGYDSVQRKKSPNHRRLPFSPYS